MKNFRRMFVIKNGEAAGWTNSTRTTFVLSVEDNVLTMKVKSGRNPFTNEINTAFGLFLQEYAQEYGQLSTYKRTNPYRFVYQQGLSGRQTTYIELDTGDGFPKRKRLLDMSCFGKVWSMSLFVYDFTDLCVACKFFRVEDGKYVYDQSHDKIGKEIDMTVIRPRYIEHEDGWTQPGNYPEGVIDIHNVVREKPVDSEEPEEDEEE